MGKSAPAAPDPVVTANAQASSNRETAISQAGLNAVNQITPNGNLSYDQIGTWSDGTPRFQATQSLSAAGQQLQNTTQATSQNLANVAQQQSGRLGSLLNRDLDFSGLPKAGNVVNGPQLQTSLGSNDFSGDRQRVEEGLFSRLNPQIDQQRQAFETQLVNRGIRPGTTAYDQQMGQFQQGVNDQRTSVLLQGGQEQSRLQGMALNAGNFANSAQQQQYGNQVNASNQQNALRQQSLNELLTQRQTPLNELLAVSGQSQVQTPQFASTPQTSVGGVDVAGITQNGYANQMANYNAGQQQLGGLFSAGASLLPLLSDRRTKMDIKPVGKLDNGLTVYSYRYIDGGGYQIGLMADEVKLVNPEAVVTGNDGFDRVRYLEAVA